MTSSTDQQQQHLISSEPNNKNNSKNKNEKQKSKKNTSKKKSLAGVIEAAMINSGLIVSIDCGEDNAKKHEHAHKSLAVAQAMKIMHTLIGDQVAQPDKLKTVFRAALKRAGFKHQPAQIMQQRRYFKTIKNGVLVLI